jgi:hypothetical protein
LTDAREAPAGVASLLVRDERVPGWDVQIDEVSIGVYRMRAVDDVGRTVEATGFDEDEPLERVRQAAHDWSPELRPDASTT